MKWGIGRAGQLQSGVGAGVGCGLRLLSLTAVAVFLVQALGAPAIARAQSNTISRINATYAIYMSGWKLGKFHFRSTFQGDRYKLLGKTEISPPIIGWFFEWKGQVRSTGAVKGSQTIPESYAFSFRSNKKAGKLHMVFADGAVSKVIEQPRKPLSRKHIPVEPAHLRGVLDPLSALMSLQRKGRSLRSACNKTIPVYDGKQRFDLRLSYKGKTRVTRAQTGAYAGPVVVCRVKYRPISGYKPSNKTVQTMARSNDIELWLIPVRGSQILVPYRINLPTQVGTASVKPIYFQIRHRSGRRVALINQ